MLLKDLGESGPELPSIGQGSSNQVRFGPAPEKRDLARRIEKIERDLESGQAPPGELSELLAYARDATLPRPLRAKAATMAALAYGSTEAERLQEEIAEPRMDRYRQSAGEFDKAMNEVGYRPAVVVRESIRSAMHLHGLTREGAVVILSALAADQAERSE